MSETFVTESFLADDGQTVAQGEDDLLDTVVGGDVIVEATDACRLLVFGVCRIHDMPVPKGVVGDDEAPVVGDPVCHFVTFDIRTFVAVDEHHVEGDAQTRSFGHGIANEKGDSVGIGRLFNPRTREFLLFVVDFEGPQVSAAVQSFCHAEGGVAAEGTHLKDILGTCHLHQHLQQPSLQMPACHASVEQMHIGGTIEAVEIVVFRIDVVEHILFEQLTGVGHRVVLFGSFTATKVTIFEKIREILVASVVIFV